MNFPTDISSCHELLAKQQEQITVLQNQVQDLVLLVKELENRINKNSRNSNKPPSSDGLQKPTPKPAFRRTNKAKGGQKGHKGKTLMQVPDADKIEKIYPSHCSKCGITFSETTKQSGKLNQITQVFDLPEPKLEVTEYQQYSCKCQHCDFLNKGSLPKEASAPVQYGHGVRAFSCLLSNGYHLSYKSIQSLFADLFDYALNESTAQTNNIRLNALLENSEQKIKQALLASAVGHSDETGIRVSNKLHWLHVFSNPKYTYLFVHQKRGKKALTAPESLLNDFENTVVHDCWASYFNINTSKHALCGAHIIRELNALEEQGGKSSKWAVWFRTFLLNLLKCTKQNVAPYENQLTPSQQKIASSFFDDLWQTADEIEPKPIKSKNKRGKPKASKGRNLLKRFKLHKEAILAFAFDPLIPFTNNQAERDLRPVKTKLKIAGSFRTFDGAKRFARIFAFISTLRKQKRNVFKELKYVFQNEVSFLETLST